MNLQLITQRILFFIAIVGLLSCEKASDVLNINEDRFVSSQLNSLSLSGSSNGVVVIPTTVNQVIRDVFNRYTAFVGASGARVHILLQAGVINEEAIKIRRILFWMLSDIDRTKNKLSIENALSAQKATIAIFRTDIEKEIALNEKLKETDLNITALTIDEVFVEGEPNYIAQTVKDRVIERCAFAVFQFGIFPSNHALLTQTSVWNSQLSTTGNLNFNEATYHYNSISSNDQNAYLFAGLVDNYFNGWINYPTIISGNQINPYPDGTSLAGALKLNGRVDMQQRFSEIASSLSAFFGDYIKVPISLSSQFEGVFLLQPATEKYTLQSQFLSQIILTGTSATSIVGNNADNILYGNANVNYFKVKGGNDFIDGGENTDFVIFAGNKSEYSISYKGNEIQVRDLVVARDSITILKNVEVGIFLDQYFNF
jgi:hypothetical protein